MNTEPTKIIWWTPPIVIAVSISIAMLIGAVTNIINVRISPFYYMYMLDRWDENKIKTFVILQGMLEGGGLGLLFGIVVAISAAASTKLRCPVRLAVGTALRVIPLALACWVAGGIATLAWAKISPHSLQSALVFYVPVSRFGNLIPDDSALPPFAWVGGSIVGGYISSIVGSLYAAVGLHMRWKRYTRLVSEGFEPIVVNLK